VTDVHESAAVEAPVDLDADELYFNRELSTAQFNERVL
jgi:polyphosphate kinase